MIRRTPNTGMVATISRAASDSSVVGPSERVPSAETTASCPGIAAWIRLGSLDVPLHDTQPGIDHGQLAWGTHECGHSVTPLQRLGREFSPGPTSRAKDEDAHTNVAVAT